MDRYEIFRANQLETKNFLESIRKGKIPRRVVIKNIITGSGIISISSFSKREICKSSFDVTKPFELVISRNFSAPFMFYDRVINFLEIFVWKIYR